MSKLNLGQMPDFVMKRGNEIVSYHCKISSQDESLAGVNRTIANRSLMMLCKEISQLAPNFKMIQEPKSDHSEKSPSGEEYVLNLSDGSTEIQLRLEQQLSKQNRQNIVDYFISYFNPTKNADLGL